MPDAATSERVAHFPPGGRAPTTAERLRDPEHLARMNAGRAAWLARPEEERRQITAERKAEKARKLAEREAREAAKRGGARVAPADDDAPPTVRSSRLTMTAPPPAEDPIGPIGRAGSSQLRGLLDICAAIPLGDGVCFIQVNRLKPTQAYGENCGGIQKPIYDPIDDAEFAIEYGGAEYQLRGYTQVDGKKRALTEPVNYRVAGAPNPSSALTEDDAPMRPNPAAQPNGRMPLRPGLVTPHAATAEADMYGRRLTHEETMDQRNAEREERQRQREEQRQQERDGRGLDAAKLIADRSEREIERAREDHAQQLERERAAKGGGMDDFAKLLTVLKPGEDTQALTRQHANEIKQLSQSHKEELMRLTEQQRLELVRITDANAAALHRVEDQARAERTRTDEQVREADRRASDQVKEVERRSEERVRDIQSQSNRQYEDLKARSEERVRDQNDQWQRRFDDLKAANDRELRQKDSELALMRTGLEGNMAVILSGKDDAIKRLEKEVREARADAEKNKDWMSKIKEAGETAEALGYTKNEGGGEGEGDEDLKTTAVKAALGMLPQLPQMITQGVAAVREMRNPTAAAEQARAQSSRAAVRGGMRTMPRSVGGQPPLMLQPLTFATEGGVEYSPPGVTEPPRANPLPMPQQQHVPLPPLEMSPTHSMLPMPQQQPVAAPQQQMEPAPAALQEAPQQQHQQPAAPQAPPQQVSVAPPAPAPGAPPAMDTNDQIVREVIGPFVPMLAQHFAQRVPAEAIAQQMVEQNGPDQARLGMQLVTTEQLLRVIAADPAYPDLATRNGQKFLRDIWAHMKKLVGE